ncbi:MAG: hypothetical protein IKC99_03935, partial [Clostridia bacterium]|nr:hypothetical protein [Clostridia bacterium]
MKSRISLLLIALLLLLSAAACRAESPLAEKPLAEIMDALYERATAEHGFVPTWNLELIDIAITPDKNDWYFGTEIEYAEALASEYVIMPPAYSVCLVRVQPGDDAAAIAETLRASADPYKWVCTSAGAVAVEY